MTPPECEHIAVMAAAEVIHKDGCAAPCGEPEFGPGGHTLGSAELALAEKVAGAVLGALGDAEGAPAGFLGYLDGDNVLRRWPPEGSTGVLPVPGEWARVDIMGHDSRTGWVSDGSLAGAACLDVRDGTGRLIAKIPPQSVYMYSPVMPPHPAAERAALPAGDGDSTEDEEVYERPRLNALDLDF